MIYGIPLDPRIIENFLSLTDRMEQLEMDIKRLERTVALMTETKEMT